MNMMMWQTGCGFKMEALHDRDIREPLFDFLEETYGKIRILEEKMMGKSRADVIMVTESALFGIEIKSDADTYVRLESQVKDYDLYFDYNYAVVGSSHAAHIEEHLPAWWGIISAERMEEKVDFYIMRKPLPNPEVKWERKIRMLWRPELAHIQELNGMPKYKEKSKLFVQEKLIEKLPPELLQRQLCEELFERDYTAITEQIQEFRLQNGKKRRRKRKKLKIKRGSL
jgi:hypothetical protein